MSDLSSKIENAPNCQHEMIDGNHRSMIRYRTADASGYRQVVSALKYYMKKLDKAHDIERACKSLTNISQNEPAIIIDDCFADLST